ncbi:MAG: hypothetical protein QOD47_586 [Gemmatimonadaceae bacterium]|nr:hypothetical protein [Gemmatimonadaceae bacterium]
MKARLIAPLVLALAIACENPQQPSGTRVQLHPGSSKIISDGAHVGGNPDFFFLPPLVPLPFGNATFAANFELGKFNNALGPSLKIEICQLVPETGNALPTVDTQCAGAPLKTFDFGSVKVVNLPLRESGWWSFLGLPADGFYYVLWDTRQSNLDVTKFYRIKIFLNGFADPLGYGDVDPMSSLREWKYSETGQAIQLVNGVWLPIPFRIEKNGSPCRNTALCTQATITNHTVGHVDQFVRVPGGAGPLAGALFPDGWLPAAGPQSVLVTIARVNTGTTNEDGTQATPCHRNLPLQQFDDCFNFSTYPKLKPISVAFPGHQFEKKVTTAVCYDRFFSEDPRSEYVQLWASDDGANFRALPDVSDGLILTPPGGRDCYNPPPEVIGDNSKGFRGLASSGLRKIRTGLGEFFGVKTAYAVDVGLGGTILDFSNVSPAMTARIDNWGLFGEGLSWTAYAKITGVTHHDGISDGINGLPVTFTIAPTSGNFGFDESENPIYQRVVYTSPDCGEGCENGIASVDVNVTGTAGPHTFTASGPALGGPITFTVTVPPPIP